jgi:hypothetical protein
MTTAVRTREPEEGKADHQPDLSPLPDLLPLPVDSDITYTEEEITPEYAAFILDNLNSNPRKLRRDKAAQYAADMSAGNWPPGMGVIGFDRDGYLVDGQHRFAACVMSGVSFRTLVARGVTQQAVDNADRGFKRGVADILKGKGEQNVTILQAALNMCCRWDYANPLSNFVPTWPQLEQYLVENPDIREAVTKCQVCVRPPLSIRGSVVGPLTFRARRIDAEAADAFLQRVHTGVGLVEDDPVLRLREQFLSRRVTAYGRPSREHDLALMIKAWNAYIVGRPLRQLKWNRGGIRQEPFPYMVGSDGTPWRFPDYVRDQARRQIAEMAGNDSDDDEGDDNTED